MDNYSEELAGFIDDLEKAKEEHEAAKAAGIKKAAMKKLNYLFSPAVQNRIQEIVKSGYCANFSESDVARTAMYLGLTQLEELKKSKKGQQLRGHMHISKTRSKLGM